jgi:predicted Zn-ribbon and HTH transcriptional regulator
LAAGDAAVGEFRCSECGYGVSVYRVLPRCPMCSGTSWEPSRVVVLQ